MGRHHIGYTLIAAGLALNALDPATSAGTTIYSMSGVSPSGTVPMLIGKVNEAGGALQNIAFVTVGNVLLALGVYFLVRG